MKKNLISVVLLALLIVNIILSSITLFSVYGTNKKTAALVTDIAKAVSLDLGGPETAAEEEKVVVSMEDVVTYDISEMTIPLRMSEGDDKAHYAILSLTLSMNSKDKDYKKYGDLSTRQSLIMGEITDVVSQYTIEEARTKGDEIEDKILERIQTLFDSKFIYNVTIISPMYQ